ncbi:MAG: precorrin-6A reductase [Bacillota bacterium]
MILVLAGTKDSREIIKQLIDRGYNLLATVTTDYGRELLENSNIKVVQDKLDEENLEALILKNKVNQIIDTTHPFATEISQLAIKVSKQLDKEYIRFEREEIEFADKELITTVKGYQAAAKEAKKYNRVLLTIGSRRLSYFTSEIDNWQKKLVARVLPTAKFVKQAEKLGFSPQNIIGMQGPFSKELNKILLQDYEIDVLITKASGKTGGLDSKVKAALSLNIRVILISRPEMDYPHLVNNQQQLLNLIK